MQCIKEYRLTSDENFITLPTPMASTNYVIMDGRKETNQSGSAGWYQKQTNGFWTDPSNKQIMDFFIVGY